MAEGCPQRLPDRQFLGCIWNLDKVGVPDVLDMIARHGPDVRILQLKSHAEVSQLLALLPAGH